MDINSNSVQQPAQNPAQNQAAENSTERLQDIDNKSQANQSAEAKAAQFETQLNQQQRVTTLSAEQSGAEFDTAADIAQNSALQAGQSDPL